MYKGERSLREERHAIKTVKKEHEQSNNLNE